MANPLHAADQVAAKQLRILDTLAAQSTPKALAAPMRPLSLIGDGIPFAAEGFDPVPLVRHAGKITPSEARQYRRSVAGLGEVLDEGMPQGWEDWHNTGQLQEYIRGLFPTAAQGDMRFRELMGLTSAASHGSGVPQELRKGTLYHYLLRRGDLPKFRDSGSAYRWAEAARDEGLIPAGYGHSMQGNDLLAISRFWDGGKSFPRRGASGEAYKIASYFANKMGDLQPGTLDTHMYRMMGAKPGRSQHYGFLEGLLERLAAERGLRPGQAQPIIWMQKGGDMGVKSLDQPSFLHYLEDMVRRRAEELGESPENVLRDVIMGNQYLYRPDRMAEGMV